MAQTRDALKSRNESCFIVSRLVRHAVDLPDPFSEGYYYKGFEFTEDCPDHASEYRYYISDFRSPYLCANPDYPQHTVGKSEYILVPSQLHIEQCGGCTHALPAACRTCERQSERKKCPSFGGMQCYCAFTRVFRLVLSLDPDYACPSGKKSSSADPECSRCRYKAEPSNLASDNSVIYVHDLRLFGHPTVVRIEYRTHRRKRKAAFLRSFPGIHAGSNSNPLRYSVRLAKAVSTALLEKLPQNYISEATCIPYDSVRSWRRREMQRLKELTCQRKVEALLKSDAVFGIQLHKVTIGKEDYRLCLQDRDGPVVCGLFANREWDSCASLFYSSDSNPTLFLEKFRASFTTHFTSYDLFFNMFAMGSHLAPNVGAYIAYRVLQFHLDWGFLPPIDLPRDLSEYLEDCWDLFETLFLPGKINEESCRSLLHRLYYGPSRYRGEDDDPEDEKMRTWYDAVSTKAELYGVVLPRADSDVILADWDLFAELNFASDAAPEDIPILLQYYNPAMLMNGTEGAEENASVPRRYRYLFDDNGDMCLPERTEKLPFISLRDFLTSLRAGILQESDFDGEYLSAKMLLLDPESAHRRDD